MFITNHSLEKDQVRNV